MLFLPATRHLPWLLLPPGTCSLLREIKQQVDDDRFTFTPMSDALSMARAIIKKAARSSTAYRGALTIGNDLVRRRDPPLPQPMSPPPA